MTLRGASSILLAALGLALWLAPVGRAAAQDAEEAREGAAPTTEEPDPTRLDVERLPPEAIPITRDLYAHGFFIEAQLGGLGFVGGPAGFLDGGPWAAIDVGFEILDWLMVLVGAEGSMHNSSAPSPPARTSIEILGGHAAVRLQANFTEAFAMWISGQVALLIATTDLLEQFGFTESTTAGVSYGGELGADWHLRSRHHSIGLLAGVRHYPSLESFISTGPALGIHGTAYIRYVF